MGDEVGVVDGAEDGPGDGALEGLEVGALVGALVGAPVGAEVGDAVTQSRPSCEQRRLSQSLLAEQPSPAGQRPSSPLMQLPPPSVQVSSPFWRPSSQVGVAVGVDDGAALGVAVIVVVGGDGEKATAYT